MPQELVIVDMEGFYKFPWGRGKNTSSQTKGDKMLQDLKLPQTSKVVKSTDNKSKKDKENPDDKSKQDTESADDKSKQDEESADDKNKQDKESLEDKSKQDNDTVSNISKKDDLVEESAIDVEYTRNTTRESDKEVVDKEIADDISAIKNSENEIVGKTNEKDKDIYTGSSKSDTDLKNEDKEKMKVITKAGSDLNSGSTHVSCNHTTIVIPDLDQQLMELPGTAAGIASRTLLSLRRAEDCSFDDIRIFNAQDNFVVNSCEIGIKIRKNLEEGKGGNPSVKRVSPDEDKSKDTAQGRDGDNVGIPQSVDDKTEGQNDPGKVKETN